MHSIMEFTGTQLIKATDASSFPSGASRATFEASRLYRMGLHLPGLFKNRRCRDVALCCPTAFASYTGEADKKTPLLRSMEAVNKQALRVLRASATRAPRKSLQPWPRAGIFLIDKNGLTNVLTSSPPAALSSARHR